MNIFICLLDCDVEAIADLAMEVLYRISGMKLDKVSIKMAKGNTLPKMVFIIKNKVKRYTDKAIEIIENCVRNKEAAIYFGFKIDFIILLGFLVECDNNTLIKILPIFSTMTKIPVIRKKIYYESGEDILFQSLKYRNEDVVLNMCKIITNFTMHKDCLEKMLTPQLIKYLLEIFGQFPMDPHKINAMLAIYSFVKYEPATINYLKYTGGLDDIQRIFLEEQDGFPTNIYEMITEIICCVVCSPLKCKLNIPKLCEKLLDLLRSNYPNVKIILKMIAMLVQESSFRQQFILSNGPEYFISVIQTDSFSQTYQLNLNIIKNVLTYEEISNQFLNLGLMTILKSMMSKGKLDPNMFEEILSGLYNSCLPIKFFDNKFLTEQDIITSLFFLFQEYKLQDDSTEFKPIYIVNLPLYDDTDSSTSENIITENPESASKQSTSTKSTTPESILLKTLNNHSPGMRAILSYSYGDYSIEENFLPEDDYLDEYIEDLQNELSLSQLDVVEITKKIALFVQRQLSGILLTDSEEEKLSIFKRHIDEICAKLGHRFIPIGYLRMGYLCEKAFLFKVLCDSIGVASSFHQEKEGLFWNSVSKGMGEDDVYIVDFKNDIGELIQIDSDEARVYLEKEE
nr:armadillo repeat-containing protein 3-like [Onthophagus taurus]